MANPKTEIKQTDNKKNYENFIRKITPNLKFEDKYLKCEESSAYRKELVALSKEPNLSIATTNDFKISGIEVGVLKTNLFEGETKTIGTTSRNISNLPDKLLKKPSTTTKYTKKEDVVESTKEFLKQIKASINKDLTLGENLTSNKSKIEENIIEKIESLQKGFDNNKALPLAFRRHILLTQIDLIEKQLGVETYQSCEDQSQEIANLFQGALEKSLSHPLKVLNAQIESIKTNNGQLNIALQNPAAEAFESKIEGVKIDDILSRVQLNALRSIDEAIVNSSKSEKGGKAVVRIGTGGGKTYLMDKINAQYVSDAAGITKIVSIDLNSSDQDKKFFSGTDSLKGQMIILDEAFFYGTEFDKTQLNPEGDDKSASEKRNIIIKNLRNRGAVVVIVGASESLEKIDLETKRLSSKIAEIDNHNNTIQEKIDTLARNKERLGEIEGLKNTFLSSKMIDKDDPTKLPRQVRKYIIGTGTDTFIKLLEELSKYEQNSALLNDVKAKLEAANTNKEVGSDDGRKLVQEAYNLVFGSKSPLITPDIGNIGDLKFRDKASLQQKLEARQEQYEGLKQRRDEKTIERLQNGKTVSPSGENEIDKIVNQLSKMQPGNRLQYIIPHIDLEVTLANQREIQKIQETTEADIIIIPFIGNDSKLGCQIYYKNSDGQFVLSDKIEQNQINAKLKEFGLTKDSKVISFFDKKNAIGGDYGDASLGITNQIIDISKIDKLTTNHLMQFNRNRGADEGVGVTFISSIDKNDLIEKIKNNTAEDDKERVIGYLENKLLDSSDEAKKAFYQKYLGDLRPQKEELLESTDDEYSNIVEKDKNSDEELKEKEENNKVLIQTQKTKTELDQLNNNPNKIAEQKLNNTITKSVIQERPNNITGGVKENLIQTQNTTQVDTKITTPVSESTNQDNNQRPNNITRGVIEKNLIQTQNTTPVSESTNQDNNQDNNQEPAGSYRCTLPEYNQKLKTLNNSEPTSPWLVKIPTSSGAANQQQDEVWKAGYKDEKGVLYDFYLCEHKPDAEIETEFKQAQQALSAMIAEANKPNPTKQNLAALNVGPTIITTPSNGQKEKIEVVFNYDFSDDKDGQKKNNYRNAAFLGLAFGEGVAGTQDIYRLEISVNTDTHQIKQRVVKFNPQDTQFEAVTGYCDDKNLVTEFNNKITDPTLQNKIASALKGIEVSVSGTGLAAKTSDTKDKPGPNPKPLNAVQLIQFSEQFQYARQG